MIEPYSQRLSLLISWRLRVGLSIGLLNSVMQMRENMMSSFDGLKVVVSQKKFNNYKGLAGTARGPIRVVKFHVGSLVRQGVASTKALEGEDLIVTSFVPTPS